MAYAYKSGDVVITAIRLYSHDLSREYNLMGQTEHIDIYESVMSPIIFAQIHIRDSIDLLRQFPIITEEFVVIVFSVPGTDSESAYSLYVKSIDNLEINEQQKSKTYTLSLVSAPLIDDSQIQVDKKFTNTEIHKAVENILKEELKLEPGNLEATKGLDNILVSNMRPFKAIDMLRRRAVSKKYQSSSYCFFENRHGYNFTTLENLFDKGKDVIGDKIFYYVTDNQHSVDQMTFRNIIAYKQIQFADSIDKIAQGGLRNDVCKLDFTTGLFEIINYNEQDKQDSFKTIDGGSAGQHSSSYLQKHSKTTAKKLLMPYDSTRPSTIPERTSILQAYAQRICQNLIHIYTWGDHEITAGDVIKCNFPSAQGITDSNQIDRISSGNFLVSKIRHIIAVGNKPIYTTSMELIKGSFFEK